MVDFKRLVTAGVHFGHSVSRWCPKMKPYIWGQKNQVHLIDVSKTAQQLERASKFLEQVAAEGKTILWVGTKKPAQAIITQAGLELGQPYVSHRWIGGTLSNNAQVKKSVTKLLHLEDVIEKSERVNPEKAGFYTKKEINVFQKLVDRLKKNVGGISNLAWPVGAVVLVDVRKERSALREAARMNIPVVALVDTNCDPEMVDYVIPGNDDAPRAIEVIIEYLKAGAVKGVEAGKTKKAEERAEVEKERAKARAVKEAAQKEAGVDTSAKVAAKREAAAPAEEGQKAQADDARSKAKKAPAKKS